MILAIETSTEVCSVALQTRAGRIYEKRTEGRGVHSGFTFLFVKELLEKTGSQIRDLDGVLFSNGPGSYTGLRIGAAAVKGLLFGREVPFYTFPTLLSFSAPLIQKTGKKTIHSVIDARREHLYYQKIEVSEKGVPVVSSPVVTRISELEKSIKKGDYVIGTGWNRLQAGLKKTETWHGAEGISARNLIVAWNHPHMRVSFNLVSPGDFEPEYLTMTQVNNSNIS